MVYFEKCTSINNKETSPGMFPQGTCLGQSQKHPCGATPWRINSGSWALKYHLVCPPGPAGPHRLPCGLLGRPFTSLHCLNGFRWSPSSGSSPSPLYPYATPHSALRMLAPVPPSARGSGRHGNILLLSSPASPRGFCNRHQGTHGSRAPH